MKYTYIKYTCVIKYTKYIKFTFSWPRVPDLGGYAVMVLAFTQQSRLNPVYLL